MVFKCKMCGGDIEPIENTLTGKCLYCKSVMTLPNLNDERIVNLYNRANDLRLNNEFDKAYGVYETILEMDNKQTEAHWGLVLCKYGVEYVDDPKTKKKVPTCHRTIISSILEDNDYKSILKESYGEALELYKEEAQKINEIQKGILEISNKEEPYDIFICYKETDEKGDRTKDSVIAEDIYDALTKEGYKVFFSRITLEDKLGTEFEPYIFSALMSAKVMLVVGTNTENLESVWVKNEWSRYLEFMKKDRSKTLIPVYSGMDAYKLPESFSTLQAQNMDKVGAMQDLVRGIKKILDISAKKNNVEMNEEMFQKFKEMLEEEKQQQKILNEKLYETVVLKEKPSVFFIISTFAISFFVAIWFLASATELHVLNGMDGPYALVNNTFLYDYVPFHFLVCLITLIAYFLGFINRKTHVFSKFMYLFNLVMESIFLIIVGGAGYRPTPYFYIYFLLMGLLFIWNTKWRITQSTLMLSKEEQEEKLENNKKITENFKENKFFIVHPVFYGVVALLFLFVFWYSFEPIPPQENFRDTSVDQILILNEYINIREDASFQSDRIGNVYKDEIYTVLDKETSYGYTWYKIETALGITGYVCEGDDTDKYIEFLPKK